MTDTKRVPHKSRIVTNCEYPPIPYRSHDWRATFDWFCGDDDQPAGWGETEAEAVLDLMRQAADFEDDGSCLEEVTNWAFEGWNTRSDLQPRVKGLSWREGTGGELAHNGLGWLYRITWANDPEVGFLLYRHESSGKTRLGAHSDPEELKKLADADNSKAILSTLDLAPVTPNLSFEHLRQHGFAPGGYHCFCSECGKQHSADKRAWRCLECAEEKAAPVTPEQAAEVTRGKLIKALIRARREKNFPIYGDNRGDWVRLTDGEAADAALKVIKEGE